MSSETSLHRAHVVADCPWCAAQREPTLDEAWRAAEDALPTGWGIGIEPSERGYEVGAGRNQWHEWDGKAHPTLAAALTALAARLRETPRKGA